jgi:hypothetical protein
LSVKHTLGLTFVLACALLARAATAAPAEDRLLPLDQYTSDKARTLATKHGPALRELNAGIYHCIPWVEVQKHSIGFFKPKHLAGGDIRYLSLRIYIEQDPSAEFAKLRVEDRASAMFSRYVGPLLRRMTKNAAIAPDAGIEGFTIILEWLKQGQRGEGDRPVHETIAIFIDKPVAVEYLAGSAPITEVAAKSRVLGFDGETALGSLRLAVWNDNFVNTYKVTNYVLEPGVTCG